MYPKLFKSPVKGQLMSFLFSSTLNNATTNTLSLHAITFFFFCPIKGYMAYQLLIPFHLLP